MGFFEMLRNAIYGNQQRTVEEKNTVTTEVGEILTGEQLLSALRPEITITRKSALEIPTVKACLNIIKGAVRETPIKLYRRDEEGQVHEIKGDRRVFLLNNETGDTLNSSEFWDALIEDYYLSGGGYAYINRNRNEIKSLHYVENELVSVVKSPNPIFKSYDLLVYDGKYRDCDFFKILRDTRDGAQGVGIIDESPMILNVAYSSLKFEKNLVATGGNKKGFIKSAKRLTEQAITKLKEAWRKLYSSNNENVVVLNDGLEFQESANTSVEMQLNENKQTNAGEICKIFNIPLGMLSGTGTSTASEDDKKKFIDFCIVPFFKTVTTALNRDLLLESEKEELFFDFDSKDIKKGSMLERFQAYNIAIKNNVMLVDECRRNENLPPLGLDFVNLNLGSVLYNAENGTCFVPNTGERFEMNDFFGNGVKNED